MCCTSGCFRKEKWGGRLYQLRWARDHGDACNGEDKVTYIDCDMKVTHTARDVCFECSTTSCPTCSIHPLFGIHVRRPRARVRVAGMLRCGDRGLRGAHQHCEPPFFAAFQWGTNGGQRCSNSNMLLTRIVDIKCPRRLCRGGICFTVRPGVGTLKGR
jgi:hypothetical protein